MDNGSFRPHHNRQDWRVPKHGQGIFLLFFGWWHCPGVPRWATAVIFRGCIHNHVPSALKVWVGTGTLCFNHKKKLSQTMVQWSEMPSSTALPSPLIFPFPYPSHVDLLYPSPRKHKRCRQALLPALLACIVMIVNCNEDDGASTIKGGAFVWKMSWARLQFQCRGVIKNLNFFIDPEGSMVWRRRKKTLL